MKTALVTGGAGFIGRHLVPMLELYGYKVVVIDPVVDEYPPFVPGEGVVSAVPFRIAMKFEEWINVWDKKEVDVVVHLAANIKPIDERLRGGIDAYQDIALDWAVARWVEKYPPKKAFIYMSSCAVDTIDDPYAWVKLTGERIFAELYRGGLPLVILRPFSGYGADQAPSYPFRAILNRVMEGQRPVQVWGSGNQVRDWIHVDDICWAILWAIDVGPKSIAPVEIGTGRGTSLGELASMIADFAFPGKVIELEYLVEKPESGHRRVADTSFARFLGFSASVRLEDGIRGAIDEWLAKETRRS